MMGERNKTRWDDGVASSMKRRYLLALSVLILCAYPRMLLSDNYPNFQRARLDPSLATTYDCDQVSGSLVRSGKFSRIFSVKEVDDPNLQYFTIVDGRGCHVTVPGFEVSVNGVSSPMDEFASPDIRPIMEQFTFSFEQRLFQKIVDSAAARCVDKDRKTIVQAYGASKYALCVERKVRWATGGVELVLVHSVENGVQTMAQILFSRERIEGIGKLVQDSNGKAYPIEFDFGVRK